VRSVLVDANVLIGYLDPDDGLHPGSVEGLAAATGNLVTTWPAVTEAVYILGGRGWPFQEALLDMIDDGELLIAPLTSEDAPRLTALMSKSRDTPMDLADAALVRVEADGAGAGPQLAATAPEVGDGQVAQQRSAQDRRHRFR